MPNLNTQITPPRVPLTDERTGAVSREWYRWFYNIYNITGGALGITPVVNGGTGLGTIPTNGQLLIGNGTGYTLNTLGFGAGISVTNGAGTITVANTGVLSNIAGTGISVSGATGNVTIANTGVLSFAGGTTGLTPAAATTGAVTLAGTLVIANGGTNGSSTPTAGAVPYGTGTAYAFTAAGTVGQVLTSNGAGVPTWTTNAGGDVTGPASSTDNAIARFDGVTGKLIQNSVTTIDDTGAATGFTTFSASTSVTTPIVQASNSAGLSLKNASGTTQMSVGAGGGDNMSINVSTNLNGANAQIDLSPTGTGHVHIKPTGVNSVEIAPTFVGEMDNITIGATTPKNGSFVDLSVTGTTSFDGSQGTAGQVLTSAGTGATPTWTTPTTGTVTTVSVVSANGLAGTVATATTTPAITLSTTVTGLLKGNGTAISAAVANIDYVPLSTVLTKTADYTITGTDTWIINNKTGSALTLTFPAASSWTGRYITVKNMQAQAVNSASSNIVPLDSTSAGTAILLAVVGNWATMVSDGTNWVIMQAASNNNLLLE
jgi:hypothetical protein